MMIKKHFIQEVRGGFTWGQVRIKKLREDEVEYLSNRVVDENLSDVADDDPTIVIPFQNENLCAYWELQDGTRTVNPFLTCSKSLASFLTRLNFHVALGHGKCSRLDHHPRFTKWVASWHA